MLRRGPSGSHADERAAGAIAKNSKPDAIKTEYNLKLQSSDNQILAPPPLIFIAI